MNSWKGKNEIAKSKVKGNLNTWKYQHKSQDLSTLPATLVILEIVTRSWTHLLI